MGMADWSWQLVDRVKYKTKHKEHWCLFPTGGEAWGVCVKKVTIEVATVGLWVSGTVGLDVS